MKIEYIEYPAFSKAFEDDLKEQYRIEKVEDHVGGFILIFLNGYRVYLGEDIIKGAYSRHRYFRETFDGVMRDIHTLIDGDILYQYKRGVGTNNG